MTRVVVVAVLVVVLACAFLGVDAAPGGCLWHTVLGLECPSCGLTRSFFASARGNWMAAVRFHPAGPFLFLYAMVVVLFMVCDMLGWRLPRRLYLRAPAIPTLILAVALLEGWLLKVLFV